jgi:hypothetical protein
VAARQNAPVLGALCSSSAHNKKAETEEDEDAKGPLVSDDERLTSRDIHHPQLWAITVGYRFQPSSRHFVGTVEQKQREVAHNQVQNIYHLLDVSLERQLTSRWSVNTSLPMGAMFSRATYRGPWSATGAEVLQTSPAILTVTPLSPITC